MTGARRRSSLILMVVGVVAVAADAGAQSATRGYSTTQSGSYLNLQPRRSQPQAPLIQPRRTPRATAEPARTARRTVVCGMTLLPGDNAVDQKMVLTVPEGAKGGAARPFALPMCDERAERRQR